MNLCLSDNSLESYNKQMYSTVELAMEKYHIAMPNRHS